MDTEEMFHSPTNGAVSVEVEGEMAAPLPPSAHEEQKPPKEHSFIQIEEPKYLIQVYRSKEKLVCECSFDPATEDPANACDENCLNRVLLIECSPSRCPCGKYCNNQRFRKHLHAEVEVFDAGKKGKGLRAKEAIKRGDFIYEYCGEVYDMDEFDRRTEQYHMEGNDHFYFMSLDNDTIIDATKEGSVSRFINHSCDPNAETQKWTVNGGTRIGFFATKDIQTEEEITFDYKYERYGDKPQFCYCGASNCRGTLGVEKQQQPEGQARRRTSAGSTSKRRKVQSDSQFAVLQDKLTDIRDEQGGLKDPAATIVLLQLMLRSETPSHRKLLLRVLAATNLTNAFEKFINFNGLRVLREWIEDSQDVMFIREALDVLPRLPISTTNMLDDAGLTKLAEKLKTSDDAVAAEKASALLTEHWKDLKKVYVIPRGSFLKNGEVRKEKSIPRIHANNFTKYTIQKIEDNARVRIQFSKSKSDRTTRTLDVLGQTLNVDRALRKIDDILQNAILQHERMEENKAAVKLAREQEEENRRLREDGENRWAMMQRTVSDPPPMTYAMPQTQQPYSLIPPSQVGIPLPEGWQSFMDQTQNRVYYYQVATQTTTWNHPGPPIVEEEKKESLAQQLASREDQSSIGGGDRKSLAVFVMSQAEIPKKEPNSRVKFRAELSKYVVALLGPFRKPKVKYGHIKSSSDFKHLARKITHTLMEKEKARHEGREDNLKMTDSVKNKVKSFIKEYMKKCGKVYQRTNLPPTLNA